MEVERLDGLICGMWSSRSISAHNQITDIRALIGLLGGDFLSLDADAMEIETIVAIAMGVEDEFLTVSVRLSRSDGVMECLLDVHQR